jgi:hypothetical protein
MNLYLLTQLENNDYDTYDSCVVAANSEEEARLIHPRYPTVIYKKEVNNWYDTYWKCIESSDWAAPNKVEVTLIGIASDNINSIKVILSSYNAG